jgi:hypothetical protein
MCFIDKVITQLDFVVTKNQLKNHKVPDLTMTIYLAATSFSRSNLELLTPLLDALPGSLSPALPNILSLTAGLFILSCFNMNYFLKIHVRCV